MAEINLTTATISRTQGSQTQTITGRTYIDYSISNTATQATITISLKYAMTRSGPSVVWGGSYLECHGNRTGMSGSQGKTGYWTVNNSSSGEFGEYYFHVSSTNPGTFATKTITITKTHETQNIPVSVHYYGTIYLYAESQTGHGGGTTRAELKAANYSTMSVSTTIPVGPKTTYAVSYNANNGTGAPGTQYKWHGEALTLSGTKPTRTGYTFSNWKATNGTTYASGASYTTDAATTMTAQWTANKYTVTFNQNSGNGMNPTSQQKTHDVALTLTTSKPSKTGYTFKGWATSEANAKAGTTTYQPGGTYNSNAAITLWAVWEINHTAPEITNIEIVRCYDNGNANDDGRCAKVSFHWKVFTGSPQYYNGSGTGYQTNRAKTCTITVGSGSVIDTLTIDTTDSQMSGTENNVSKILGSSSIYESDSTYPVTITFSDNPPLGSSLTTTARGTLQTTFFPMDFNADASALGFFMPAPNNGNGAYFGKDVHIFVDSATTQGIDGQIAQALTNLKWTSVLK